MSQGKETKSEREQRIEIMRNQHNNALDKEKRKKRKN